MAQFIPSILFLKNLAIRIVAEEVQTNEWLAALRQGHALAGYVAMIGIAERTETQSH